MSKFSLHNRLRDSGTAGLRVEQILEVPCPEVPKSSEEAKRKYREEHWEDDLQKAFDAGKRIAETITKE